jgi:hypothetical protein
MKREIPAQAGSLANGGEPWRKTLNSVTRPWGQRLSSPRKADVP